MNREGRVVISMEPTGERGALITMRTSDGVEHIEIRVREGGSILHLKGPDHDKPRVLVGPTIRNNSSLGTGHVGVTSHSTAAVFTPEMGARLKRLEKAVDAPQRQEPPASTAGEFKGGVRDYVAGRFLGTDPLPAMEKPFAAGFDAKGADVVGTWNLWVSFYKRATTERRKLRNAAEVDPGGALSEGVQRGYMVASQRAERFRALLYRKLGRKVADPVK